MTAKSIPLFATLECNTCVHSLYVFFQLLSQIAFFLAFFPSLQALRSEPYLHLGKTTWLCRGNTKKKRATGIDAGCFETDKPASHRFMPTRNLHKASTRYLILAMSQSSLTVMESEIYHRKENTEIGFNL